MLEHVGSSVHDDTKYILFIFVTLRTKYRSKKDEKVVREADGAAISTRHETYIFTRNGGLTLQGATIEIGVASETNKISLPSVSPVSPRTCRFFLRFAGEARKQTKLRHPGTEMHGPLLPLLWFSVSYE